MTADDPRTHIVIWRDRTHAGPNLDVIGVVPPMFVFLLPGLTWRSFAALLLGLAIIIGQPRDVIAADVQVSIVQPGDTLTLRYDPASISIVAGSTVTWTNNGAMSVTITSPDGLFDSETVAPGGSFSHVFDTPGSFRYFCVPYPHMKGVIDVTAP